MRDMTTPLKKVLGYGSAHEGTDHFWKQRVSAIANVPLTLFFVGLVVALNGASYEETRAALANPFVGLLLGLTLFAVLYHMRLGMQSIIEDYLHNEGVKLLALMLNTFFTILIGASALYALIKLTLGA
ncbi:MULTISPECIES: succinate dehydrogenase, hydrophobic membrane anchor protein [Mesorhizobium]|uniref:Succinate dehydrogenase hydrophobic membrane anchor subunit n=1 Tax=Mesorhizobium denitrificans TaxID=2294114 RepID=A0A371XGM9_9HYPH|nr:MULTISPECIES: succinate dehydrogenase, hydrophobic membrane anchor protein [Mesorhizobium]RFC68368.1 succinate dehydrogenase, hydrophobic membrane anchor protein [Mesorhizobium denitrificans]